MKQIRFFLPGIIVLGALFLVSPAAVAQYTRNSDVIDQLIRLSTAAQLAPPSISYPMGVREAVRWADWLAATTPDPAITRQARAIAGDLRRELQVMTIAADVTGTVVGTTWDQGEILERDYGRVYQTMEPFFTLGLWLEHPSGVRLSIREERQRELRRAAYFNTPLFPAGKPLATENNSIREGYIRTYLGPLQLTFGRQDLEIGPSALTSVVINPDIPFVDGFRLSGVFGDLTMTYLASSLENREATNDVTIQSESPEFYDFGRNVIFFNIHYFEYRRGRTRVGIGSSVILAREMNAFQLTDFFPVASWHNANITPNNHSLFLDASVVAAPGVEVYGAVGLDDFNGQTVGISDSDIPTIPAGIIGVRTVHTHSSGMTVRSTTELGGTHYLWGNFNDGDELARGIYRMDLFGDNRWMPLTSRYGPGVTWLIAETSIERQLWDDSRITAGIQVEYLRRRDGISLTSSYAELADPDSSTFTDETRIGVPVGLDVGQTVSVKAVPQLHITDGTVRGGFTGRVQVRYHGRHRAEAEPSW